MRHLELFSGIGGFRTALDLLQKDGIMDFQHVGYSEIDEKAIITYCANYSTKGEIALGDIVKFTEDPHNIENLPDFELLTGGFPCQSFSLMGQQKGFADERGQMFFRILDIVKIKRPTYLLLENVKNLFTHNKGNTFRYIVSLLQEEGYHVFFDIFNTKDFNLPQTRNRVLIFATRNNVTDDFEFSSSRVKSAFDNIKIKMSIEQHSSVLSILDKHVPDKYVLSERIKPTILSNGSAKFRSNSEINLMIARPLTASMHKMHRACQDNYYSLDFISSGGTKNPALTKTKEELAKIPIRKLTPNEAMMLQGFPKGFANNASKAGVGDGSLYKQAGNAVSVNTIYAVLYYLITNHIIKE